MAAEIAAQPNVMTCLRPGTVVEKKARPVKDQAINCPRCNSTNTKFCYYNNYSLTQPRYFCKTCRRYWTEGGTLRNVPVGGGSRKNRRSSSSSISSSSSSSSSSQKLPDLNPNNPSTVSLQNPNFACSQDLNLGFQTLTHDHQFHGVPQFLELSKMDSVSNNGNNHLGITPISAMELLRTGIASRGFTSFISSPAPPDSNALYTSPGFPFQELNKPTTGHDSGAALNGDDVQENGGARIMFKQLSSTYNESDHLHHHHHHHQITKGQENNSIAGYNWNGMFSGGSW